MIKIYRETVSKKAQDAGSVPCRQLFDTSIRRRAEFLLVILASDCSWFPARLR